MEFPFRRLVTDSNLPIPYPNPRNCLESDFDLDTGVQKSYDGFPHKLYQ